MNERIQQLALQALQLVADEHTGGDESRLNTDSCHVKDLIQAKFAELIVGECFYCVEILEKIAHSSNADIPPDYDQHTYLKTLETVKVLMKVHFGVEE